MKEQRKHIDIARQIYLKRLINRMHNGMIKVITGIRRSGKSYLLLNLFYNYLLENNVPKENILVIELDDLVNLPLREPLKLYEHIINNLAPKGMNYVILDEIQFVPEFSDILNSLLHMKNVDAYVTGSNSKFLSSDVLTEFRGRGDEVRVYPLSFSEFFSVYDGSFEKAIDEYMIFGGMPKTASMNTHEQKMNYLKNLFTETYLKDILERNNIRKNQEFEDVLNVLASSIACLINPSKLENTFNSVKKMQISRNTIENYIQYLKEAFILEEAIRYDIKGRRYISTPFKYYFVDTGLRNARLDFRQIEHSHLMENIIYNDLLIKGYNVDIGSVDIRERNSENKSLRKNLEVDFIANKGMNKIYIQSALTITDEEKKEQELKSLLHIDDSFKKMIVVKEDIVPRIDGKGIHIIGLKDFLLDFE